MSIPPGEMRWVSRQKDQNHPPPTHQPLHLPPATLKPMPLQPYLKRIIEGGETLSRPDSAELLQTILRDLSPTDGTASLRKHHFAFFHAPSLHPAMKAVMPVRRALGIRTIFHLVGPLSNPAGASAQVMGVYAPHLVPLAAEAMVLLN